jgi:hypothetical protein
MNATRLSVLGLCVFVAATAALAGPLVPGVALEESDEPTQLSTGFDTGADGLDADRRFSSGPISTTTDRGNDSATAVVSLSVETGDSPATVTARLDAENATDDSVTIPAEETAAVELSPALALDRAETTNATLLVDVTIDEQTYRLARSEVVFE